MKLRYEQCRGNRLKSQMDGFEAINCELGWNIDLRTWTEEIESGKYGYSTHAPCKSVRAFRRMLKKAPKGVEFKMWNKYEGCCVYGFGCV